jgi:hypothetical protein
MERFESQNMGDRRRRPSSSTKPRTESTDKLKEKWDGPYADVEKSRLGAYRLSDYQGKVLEHSWNVDSLHCFFI